mgnify:CR=1 FL=1
MTINASIVQEGIGYLRIWRDQMLAGDMIASSKFNRGHRASVLINAAQLVLLCILLWRIGLSPVMP